MAERPEVIIDGVRYIPASEAVAGLDDLRIALEDVFWGEGYKAGDPNRASSLFVSVYDDGDGKPLLQFMDELAASIERRHLDPPTPAHRGGGEL